MKIEEGMILENKTCDAIDPITLHETNPHIEKILVVEIKEKYIKLYNLNIGQFFKLEPRMLEIYIKRKIYNITNERA